MTTSTGLFQCLNPASIGNVTLNGTTLTSPYTSTITTTNDNWLITPQGTGYFIPKGNDNLEIRFQNQTTPDQSGADYAAPVTTVMAAKAYLNHGVKPSNKTYSFVVVPATTSSAMQTIATQLSNGGGSIYQILSQSSAYHALLYKPLNITAYSFFSAVNNLTFGIVKSTTSPHLLMDKYDATLNRHSFAISDPNLHPQNDATYGWIATSSQTTLTLNGSWQPITPVSGVVFSTPVNGVTQVTVTMYNGEPIYFGAMPLTNVATFNPVADQNWVTFKKTTNLLKIDFPEGNDSKTTIIISDSKGRDIINKTINSVSSSLELPIDVLKQGFYLCTVSNLQKNQTFKFIK